MKLEIKKIKECPMSLNTHEIKIDGAPVDGNGLLKINVSMPAGETPKINLEYRATELDIQTDAEVLAQSMTDYMEKQNGAFNSLTTGPSEIKGEPDK